MYMYTICIICISIYNLLNIAVKFKEHLEAASKLGIAVFEILECWCAVHEFLVHHLLGRIRLEQVIDTHTHTHTNTLHTHTHECLYDLNTVIAYMTYMW